MKHMLFFHVFTVCLISFNTLAQEPMVSQERNTVIIGLDPAASWAWHLTDCTPSSVSPEEVNEVDKIVLEAIQTHNASAQAPLLGGKIDPESYIFQLVPANNAKGEKLVWVNAFCKNYGTPGPYQTQVVEVYDGGNCFFNVVINLNQKTANDFYVN